MEMTNGVKLDGHMSDFLSASDLWDLASMNNATHDTAHSASWQRLFQPDVNCPPHQLDVDRQDEKLQFEGMAGHIASSHQDLLASGGQSEESAAVTQATHLSTPKRTGRLFTKAQIAELERRFQQWQYVSNEKADGLAKDLAITATQVKTWFTNRRSKAKHPSARWRTAQLTDSHNSIQPKKDKIRTAISSSLPAHGVVSNKERKRKSVKQNGAEACQTERSMTSSVSQSMYCGATIECSSKLQALLMLPSQVSSSQLSLQQALLSSSNKTNNLPIKSECYVSQQETTDDQSPMSYTDRYELPSNALITTTNSPLNDWLGLSNASYPNQHSPLSTNSSAVMDMMEAGLTNYDQHEDYMAMYSGCGVASTGLGLPSHMDSTNYYTTYMGCPVDPFLLNQFY